MANIQQMRLGRTKALAHNPIEAHELGMSGGIDSRLMFHTCSPHSVALMQLRFTSFAEINLRWEFHPQACAHAGRTKTKALPRKEKRLLVTPATELRQQ